MPANEDDDDATLVGRCSRGDESAWASLVRRYQRLVHTIVKRAGLDAHDAADVFQTVFERLLNHLPRLNDPSRLRAWIVTCSKREAILAIQRGRRVVAVGDDSLNALPDNALLPDEVLDELQQADQLRSALERIDTRCRDLLSLCFSDEELPYEEVGQRLCMPVGSIGPTRARCIDKLRKTLRQNVPS